MRLHCTQSNTFYGDTGRSKNFRELKADLDIENMSVQCEDQRDFSWNVTLYKKYSKMTKAQKVSTGCGDKIQYLE